MTATTAIANQ
jgi:hypothetical protein